MRTMTFRNGGGRLGAGTLAAAGLLLAFAGCDNDGGQAGLAVPPDAGGADVSSTPPLYVLSLRVAAPGQGEDQWVMFPISSLEKVTIELGKRDCTRREASAISPLAARFSAFAEKAIVGRSPPALMNLRAFRGGRLVSSGDQVDRLERPAPQLVLHGSPKGDHAQTEVPAAGDLWHLERIR
jgi:hypothetical protein